MNAKTSALLEYSNQCTFHRQYATILHRYCSEVCDISLPKFLKHFMHAFSITITHFITIITIFLLKCWTQTCSIDLKGKAYRLLLWCLHMLYHALSLLLSSCTSHVRVAAAGEVAKISSIWEGRVGFRFITCGNIQLLLWKSYKLYPIVPLFVATFRIHADDDNNPIPCIQLTP